MLCRVRRDATFTSCYRFQIGTIGDRFKSVPGHPTELLGNHSVLDPPDPIPNSEVKRNCADDSVGSPHEKVGHCQAFNFKTPYHSYGDYFISWGNDLRRSDKAFASAHGARCSQGIRFAHGLGPCQALIRKPCSVATGTIFSGGKINQPFIVVIATAQSP